MRRRHGRGSRDLQRNRRRSLSMRGTRLGLALACVRALGGVSLVFVDFVTVATHALHHVLGRLDFDHALRQAKTKSKRDKHRRHLWYFLQVVPRSVRAACAPTDRAADGIIWKNNRDAALCASPPSPIRHRFPIRARQPLPRPRLHWSSSLRESSR